MSSHRDREFGRIAVKNNFLEKDQLEECLGIQESLKARLGKKPALEEVLVERGLLSDTQVKVVRKVLERIDRGKSSSLSLELPEKKRERQPGESKRSRPQRAPEEVEAEGRSTESCPACGEPRPVAGGVCPACGILLPTLSAAPPPRAQKKLSPILLVILGVSLLSTAVLAGVLLLGGGRGSGRSSRQEEAREGAGEVSVPRDRFDSLVSRVGDARKAEARGAIEKFDKWNGIEEEAEELLALAGSGDSMRKELGKYKSEAVREKESIRRDAEKSLREGVGAAKRAAKGGDGAEARRLAGEAKAEIELWLARGDEDSSGSRGLAKLAEEVTGLVGTLAQGGGVDKEYSEFEFLTGELAPVEEAADWEGRKESRRRFHELAVLLGKDLPKDDPRRAWLDEAVRQVQALEARFPDTGESEPSTGSEADGSRGPGESPRENGPLEDSFPPDGPWTLLLPGGEPDAGTVLEALVPLVTQEDAANADPQFFATAFEEGVGILVDEDGRRHPGILVEEGDHWVVRAADRRYTLPKSRVKEIVHGSTYLSHPMPEAVRDVDLAPIPGRPVSVEAEGILFEGEGARPEPVPFEEICPEDLYPVLQSLFLVEGSPREHLDLGRFCLARSLESEAREEYLEAVRRDASLLARGLPWFRPEAFYSVVDVRAAEDPGAHLLLAFWVKSVGGVEDSRFLGQIRRAMELDPEVHGGPWMRLALALWFHSQGKLEKAREEASALAQVGDIGEEAAGVLARLTTIFEAEWMDKEGERARDRRGEIAAKLLEAVRKRAAARAREGLSLKEDRAWAQSDTGLFGEVVEDLSGSSVHSPSELEKAWRGRTSAGPASWPGEVFLVADSLWVVELPRILNTVEKPPTVGRAQASWYESLAASDRAELLVILFAKRNMQEVGREEVPCDRCEGEGAVQGAEDYKERFGSLEKLCAGCHGLGKHIRYTWR